MTELTQPTAGFSLSGRLSNLLFVTGVTLVALGALNAFKGGGLTLDYKVIPGKATRHGDDLCVRKLEIRVINTLTDPIRVLGMDAYCCSPPFGFGVDRIRNSEAQLEPGQVYELECSASFSISGPDQLERVAGQILFCVNGTLHSQEVHVAMSRQESVAIAEDSLNQ